MSDHAPEIVALAEAILEHPGWDDSWMGPEGTDSMCRIIERHMAPLVSMEKWHSSCNWRQRAYARLGGVRDDMSPSDVAVVQRFLKEPDHYNPKGAANA